MPEYLEWQKLPVFESIEDGTTVYFKDYDGFIWKGKYEQFESHRNCRGYYPDMVAIRKI